MSNSQPLDLSGEFGATNAAKLALAYEAALRELGAEPPGRLPDHQTRLGIAARLIAQAKRGVFDPDRLTAAALGKPA